MKNNRVRHYRLGASIGVFLMCLTAGAVAETLEEMNSWTYHHERDPLNNIEYSLARSPLPERGMYDRLRLEILCKENRLQFVLDANTLLASKGRAFEFEYQIDKTAPVVINMKGVSDKRHGYTDENVDRIVRDMVSGESIFIRAHTMIRTVLTSLITLKGAEQPIQQVLADCGVALSGKGPNQSTYNLADFERDLKTLSPEKQRQVLDKIKRMIDEMKVQGSK